MIGKQSKYCPLPQLLKQQLSKITLLPVGQSDSPTMSVFLKKILGEITHQYHHYVIFFIVVDDDIMADDGINHLNQYHHISSYINISSIIIHHHPSSSINH